MKYHQTSRETTVMKSHIRKIEDQYNYDGVSFPASFDDIKVFEENNKIGVLVYIIEDKTIIK